MLPLGRLVEFRGVPPRSGGPKGSRDPLNLGDMDDAAWQVEQALQTLEDKHQVIAHEHYRWNGYSDEKARRLGLPRRTYYDQLDALHHALLTAMRHHMGRRRRG